MKRYRVYMQQTVSYPLEVEAESAETAEEEAHRIGLPGLMFLDHRYPDEGEWEVSEVEEL